MARILVVGSANVDHMIMLARLPLAGETVSGGTLSTGFGGKGANQALAARRLGAEVRFIGRVGSDAHGQALRDRLGAEGVGIDGLGTDDTLATGTALIVVDRDGRNQIAVAPGANAGLGVAAIAARRLDFEWAGIVVCQLEVPVEAVRAALGFARRMGVPTLVNPAPAPEDGRLDLGGPVDVLTPNEGEARQLAGALDGAVPIEDVAARLRDADAGPRGLVVVTLGAGGALAVTAAEVLRVPAQPVELVDTTGAGDAFTGALAVALAEGRALRAALAWANAAAALACTRRGAQDALPQRGEVERLLGR